MRFIMSEYIVQVSSSQVSSSEVGQTMSHTTCGSVFIDHTSLIIPTDFIGQTNRTHKA